MTTLTNPPRTDPTPEQILRHLRRCNDVAQRAVALGHHPFGAVLVGPDHESVLLEQCNIDVVNHAEVEPCCMCAGTVYWANIGRVVFAMTEAQLLLHTGNHHENPTMSVSSGYVFSHGQKAIELIGPVPAVEPDVAALHRAFWASA
jgi:tRNA(Arg) A34 adenosine deaminase TadA